MSYPFLIPTAYLEEVRRSLNQTTYLSRLFPTTPLSPEEKERMRLTSAWREKREEEAYTLAPWLRAEVERDDW